MYTPLKNSWEATIPLSQHSNHRTAADVTWASASSASLRDLCGSRLLLLLF